jgi:hypothetical protein
MGVLFAQPVALGVDDALDPDRLGQQRRHHTQNFTVRSKSRSALNRKSTPSAPTALRFSRIGTQT